MESSEKVSDFYLLQLQLTNQGISCPHCQEYSESLHQTKHILVRDLSIFGVEVYLRVPRRKFYCNQCQRYATERLTWLTTKQLFTDTALPAAMRYSLISKSHLVSGLKIKRCTS